MPTGPTIKTVLTTVTWQDHEIDQIRHAFAPPNSSSSSKDTATIQSTLARAEVAVLSGDLDESVLQHQNLVWVHCYHAGLNMSARRDVFDRGLIVIGSAGRSGPALAQHAFCFAMCFVYDVRMPLAREDAHDWIGAEVYRERVALWGRKLAVVGFGYTGRDMARLGRAFGMRVTVLRQSKGSSCLDVDVMLSTEAEDGLDQILECEVIMLCHQPIGCYLPSLRKGRVFQDEKGAYHRQYGERGCDR